MDGTSRQHLPFVAAGGPHLKVIAEGVETPGQLAFLRKHGCDEIQGYYTSPPLENERRRRLPPIRIASIPKCRQRTVN